MPLNPKYKSQIAKADIVAEKVRRLYLLAIDELVRNTKGLKIDPEKPFNFNKHPRLKAKLEEILKRLSKQVVTEINEATSEEWLRAVDNNNKLLEFYIKRNLLTPEQITAYTGRNLEALKQFQKRKINGLGLSERVWKYSKQFRSELEMGLDLGFQEGKSASQLSRDLRQYLEEPNRLYRRVRDKHGNLHLSKQAQKYRPGQGVYRSSYKNAMRLTRTEINMSYRASDHEKYKQFDFVLGYEIKRSNQVFSCGICERLKGKYPKEFKFVGWHPQCRCYTEPILNDLDEFIEQQKAFLEGREYIPSKQITKTPDNFNKWVVDNFNKIQHADKKRTLLYFLKDNKKFWEKLKSLVVGKSETSTKFNDIVQKLKDRKVEYKEVKKLSKQLTDEEIISKIAGGDLTKGSCASLSFAYAGNKLGYDVTDFRGGESQRFFSTKGNLISIAEKVGAFIEKDVNDFKAVNRLVANAEMGKEYILITGGHASIVRKTEKVGLQYLELQDKISKGNGYNPLTMQKLRIRFNCKKSRTSYGQKLTSSSILIDIDKFKEDSSFNEILGYLNTSADKQMKGIKGGLK